MDEVVLHPVSITMPADELRARYVKVALNGNPNPLWHFEMAVSRASRLAPPARDVPAAGGGMISLALIHLDDPPFDTEVFGMHLLYEVDPADWLEEWIARNAMVVLSHKRLSTLGGMVGDVVVSWQVDGARWMGRVFACKAGPRLMLIWFRAAAENYPRLAEGMFLAISTFKMTDESPGPLAEQVRWVAGERPLEWRVAVPVSWQIMPEKGTDRVGSFQATLLAAAGEGSSHQSPAMPEVMLGKLSMAVMGLEVVAAAEEALARMMEALKDAGVSVSGATLEPEAPREPYEATWLCDAAAVVNARPARMRCRVMRHAKVWVAALVLGPEPKEMPDVWMRVKRMLDIATMTLEMKG
ncbi:MAG TPA: hypothetical protein VGN88_13860 [Phycisphaerae bacterium]|jgi:hypothetical protein